jgi:hypothetical protein
MPLVTQLKKVRFEPFVNREDSSTTWSADISKEFGLPATTFHPGETHDLNLVFKVVIDGYPRLKGNAERRSLDGEGVWLLSEVSVETHQVLPLELRRKVDTQDLKTLQANRPAGQLWVFQNRAYSTSDPYGLTAEDVRALINVEANKRRLTLEKAHALQSMSDSYDKPKRRESIPQAVRLEVWQRDRGRCVECESQSKLEFDHIIPVAMGGGNTSRNLQLLCETCNRRKGASLG